MEPMAVDKICKEDFSWLQRWLYDRSSIVLEDGRKFFAEKRLQPLLYPLRLTDLRQLFGRLRSEPDSDLAGEVLEALTQSETWFFRDMPVFEALRDQVLPRLIGRAGGRRIRVWSAGCSTGQEPYSLAMALSASLGSEWHRQVELSACDLSSRQVAHAKDGAYHRDEVNRGLPASMLARHFTQLGTRWHIDESFRENVSFETLRLDRPWPLREPYDVILLRNVLYYFNEADRAELLWRIRKQLVPDGVLMLGSAEQNELADGFVKVEQGRACFYQRAALPSPVGPMDLRFLAA